MTTLLIDGDMLVYRCMAGIETEICWSRNEDIWTLHTNLAEARDIITSQVDKLKEDLTADDVVFCFTGPENFRKEIYPTYKEKRKTTRKPLGYGEIIKWCLDHPDWGASMKHNTEADDALGILATHPDNLGHTIIVSEDKDLQSIPGLIYQKNELRDISEAQADRYFYTQALTGDTVDGYPGCPGIGPKRASDILSKTKPGEEWNAILAAYQKAGLTEEEALAQTRCARILRYTDWNIEKQEPILWTPPK